MGPGESEYEVEERDALTCCACSLPKLPVRCTHCAATQQRLGLKGASFYGGYDMTLVCKKCLACSLLLSLCSEPLLHVA